MNLLNIKQDQTVIDLPSGSFELNEPIVFDKPVHIRGTVGTVINAPNGAFIFKHYDRDRTAKDSVIENVKIVGKGKQNRGEGIGIETNARISLINVNAERYYTSIKIDASTKDNNGNANQCYLQRVTVNSSDYGLVINGRDANACNIYHLNATNCPELGVVDTSLLGNNYFGLHIDNANAQFGTNVGVNKSTIHGLYFESGKGNYINLGYKSIILGGLYEPKDIKWDGYHQHGSYKGLATYGNKIIKKKWWELFK